MRFVCLLLADIPMTTSPRSLAMLQNIAALDLRMHTLNEQLDEFEAMLTNYEQRRVYQDDLFEDGIVEEYHVDDRFLTIADLESSIHIDSDSDDDETVVYSTEFNYYYDSEDDTETLVGEWEDPFTTPEPWPVRSEQVSWNVFED